MTISKTPWPTKAVMDQIYQKQLWGGETHPFYSGEGSHNPAIITPYINAVIQFLNTKNNALSITDLGCGDFNVGKHFINYTPQYIAIDIVEHLIAHNKKQFQHQALKFQCFNIVTSELPKTDVAILRQVLQHLSNQEILAIVHKLYTYKYVIVTEHLPNYNFTPNADMVTSLTNRLKKHSGVISTEAPFYFKTAQQKVLHNYVLANGKSKIQTVLYTL